MLKPLFPDALPVGDGRRKPEQLRRAAMADGDPFPLLQPLNHLPLSTQNDSGSMLMPLDPPEKFTVGEHSPASVLSVLCVADTRVPLSVTQRFPPLFYSNSRFCAILQKSYLLFVSSKNCETNFVAFLEEDSF